MRNGVSDSVYLRVYNVVTGQLRDQWPLYPCNLPTLTSMEDEMETLLALSMMAAAEIQTTERATQSMSRTSSSSSTTACTCASTPLVSDVDAKE